MLGHIYSFDATPFKKQINRPLPVQESISSRKDAQNANNILLPNSIVVAPMETVVLLVNTVRCSEQSPDVRILHSFRYQARVSPGKLFAGFNSRWCSRDGTGAKE